jgi:hypothetical protein
MSGYECSEVGGGCGRRFRSLEGFDGHLKHHSDCDMPTCLTTTYMTDHGWRFEAGYWLSPRDQKARTRFESRGVGDHL